MVETILFQLDDTALVDLSVELDRLHEIAVAANPAEEPEGWPRNTGDNRQSRVWARGHAFAHARVIPQYGDLIATAVAARKAHRSDWRAGEAAEAEVAKAYAAPGAADAERYGAVGVAAWSIAWGAALFGHCEECLEAAVA